MIDWRAEFELDEESASKIAEAVQNHPMTLKDCAFIIEMFAELYNSMEEYKCLNNSDNIVHNIFTEGLIKTVPTMF